MLKGLPASGKSTYARKLVDHNSGKYRRVNRDDLRKMMDNGKWSREKEKSIVAIEKSVASIHIFNGYTVIVDDTNLSDKTQTMWKTFAIELGVELEVIDFTDVPIDECIKRDQKRANYVGEKVIKRMHNQFLSKPTSRVDMNNDQLPKAVICDIDGTIAFHDDRDVYNTALCESDTLNESLDSILLSMSLHLGTVPIFVSGRSDEFRQQTQIWLGNHVSDDGPLYMRKSGDTRNDTIIKEEIYNEHIKDKYNVVAVFDDRLRVCRLWHNLGLPIYRIGDPDADF